MCTVERLYLKERTPMFTVKYINRVIMYNNTNVTWFKHIFYSEIFTDTRITHTTDVYAAS